MKNSFVSIIIGSTISLVLVTGRAYLFKRVVNLTYSGVQDRVMLTGRHMVRDVMCKNCREKLGWMYEFATEESQKYKEGRVILEYALITESEGFQDPYGVGQSSTGYRDREHH